MKKIWIGLVCVTMALSGCAGTQKPVDMNRFLVTESIALTEEMHALSGDEEYLQFLTTSDEIEKITAQIAAQNYAKPENVYLIKLPDTMLREFLQTQGEVTVSDELLKKMRYKWNGISFAGMINGYSGVETLAATSMMSWEKAYIQPEGWADDIILLLDYDGDFSSIVSFIQSGDGVIGASASFVRDDGGDLMASFTEKLGGIVFDSVALSSEELNSLLAA